MNVNLVELPMDGWVLTSRLFVYNTYWFGVTLSPVFERREDAEKALECVAEALANEERGCDYRVERSEGAAVSPQEAPDGR